MNFLLFYPTFPTISGYFSIFFLICSSFKLFFLDFNQKTGYFSKLFCHHSNNPRSVFAACIFADFQTHRAGLIATHKKLQDFSWSFVIAIYNLINQLFCKFKWVNLNAWSHCRCKYYTLKELTFYCCWSSFVDCIDKSLEVVCDLFISK